MYCIYEFCKTSNGQGLFHAIFMSIKLTITQIAIINLNICYKKIFMKYLKPFFNETKKKSIITLNTL